MSIADKRIAPDYLLVDKKIKDALIPALIKEIKAAYGEDAELSESYGRIAHEKHFNRLLSLIQNSTLLHGGNHNKETRYFEPTLLEVADSSHPTMQDEIFGPILPIMTYKDESEIDSIVSRFERPLGFYIFQNAINSFNHCLNAIRLEVE